MSDFLKWTEILVLLRTFGFSMMSQISTTWVDLTIRLLQRFYENLRVAIDD